MNVIDLLRQYNVQVAPSGHHHTTADFYQVDCPHCSPSSQKYRLGIHKGGKFANCWSCGGHGILGVLHLLTGESYGVLKNLIGSLERVADTQVPRGRLQIPSGVGKLLPAHRRYLRSRGFDPDEIARLWGVGGIGIAIRLQWRLFIPIVLEGNTVSWTTRAIGDVVRRYHSAAPGDEIIDHKTLLYGEDYARHGVVVVEGPTDVWRVGPGAVCTFGAGFKRAQINRMLRYPRRIVCYDREAQAQARARRLCELLMPYPGETVNVVLDSPDPGSATEGEIKRLRKMLS